MDPQPSSLTFKFRFLKNGDVQSTFRKKGEATEEQLTLGKDIIDYDTIVDKATRDNRLLILLASGTQVSKKISKLLDEENALALEIYKVKALDLEKYISRICSKRDVARNKQRLIDEGKGDLFKSITCPNCAAEIDLSELDDTKYVYCNFCETVFTHDKQITTNGDIYKICDECGLFGRVKGYTEAYFYFLLVVYGFSYKRRHLCDYCVNRVFWKTFFSNLIFILGLPSSIYMKLRSLKGRDQADKELLAATRLSIKGKTMEAEDYYRRLNQSYKGHPGISFNEAMGHFVAENYDQAIKCLDKSLAECNTYLPTIRLIMELQNAAEESGEV